jgi:hypothetical protein
MKAGFVSSSPTERERIRRRSSALITARLQALLGELAVRGITVTQERAPRRIACGRSHGGRDVGTGGKCASTLRPVSASRILRVAES